jgi:hypothetical protein
MKSKLIFPMVLVLFAGACGGRNGARGTAAQQQYETVEEGSAAGVTSTIHGPGETLPPITGTNADTTTAFALNTGAVPTPQASAGGLPPMQASPYEPPPMTPASIPSARPVARQASQPPQQQQQVEPQPAQPQPAEPTAGPAENRPETDTATTTATPPQTTTTAPAPPPAEEKPPAEDNNDEQAEEPPPPPPPAV